MQRQLSSSDAGMGPTGTGTVQETGNLHPPTAAMNQAASSQDVAKQNQGEPTASQSAQTGTSDAASSPMAAEDSLKQARQFDKKQLGIE